MRRTRLFFLVSLFAASAVAQPAPNAAPAPVADTGFTADGKIKLGYEGRGNYRKPKTASPATLPAQNQAQPAQAMPTARNITTPANAPRGAAPDQAAANQTAASQTPATATEQVKKLSSDRDLSSDMDKIRARREAVAKAKETPAPAATPPSAQPATSTSNPITNNGLPPLPAPTNKTLVVVGGKVVQQ